MFLVAGACYIARVSEMLQEYWLVLVGLMVYSYTFFLGSCLRLSNSISIVSQVIQSYVLSGWDYVVWNEDVGGGLTAIRITSGLFYPLGQSSKLEESPAAREAYPGYVLKRSLVE